MRQYPRSGLTSSYVSPNRGLNGLLCLKKETKDDSESSKFSSNHRKLESIPQVNHHTI